MATHRKKAKSSSDMVSDNGMPQTGKEVQTRFKPFTEALVQSLTDAASFSKGKSYFSNGYIVDPVLRGDTLRAKSLGQSGGPYTVQATLIPADDPEKGPIADYSC